MDTAASWGRVWSRNALPSGVMHYPVGDGAHSGCTAARYGQVMHYPVGDGACSGCTAARYGHVMHYPVGDGARSGYCSQLGMGLVT